MKQLCRTTPKRIETVVFISNYFNHHQKPLSDALFSLLGGGYYFIETEPMSEERIKLGYGMATYPEYVIRSADFQKNDYSSLINGADAVIIGSASNKLLKERRREGKLIFRYSERILKNKKGGWKFPLRCALLQKNNPFFKPVYLLCASAYSAADYQKFGCFRNKCYKWGYFPAVKQYDDIQEQIIRKKKANSILWCARMIDWKHPELALDIAKRLQADGVDFSMDFIGIGPMEDFLRDEIRSAGLEEQVHMLGAMKPEEVRVHMEESEIFLFTSDRNEGWGAVLNESMNSGCAVVSSHEIGAVPFLVRDKENGLIYRDGDADDLYSKVRWLLEHRSERELMGVKAYNTLRDEWNAENAAKRFLILANAIQNGEKNPDIVADGVCSRAEVLQDNWYYTRNKRRS